MSSHNEELSIYQRSLVNLCSHAIEFLPLIWAQPVIPGRTSCLCFCVSLYKGRYSMRSGRGPTKLISPLSTLKSSGSSSILVFLKNLPKSTSLSLSGSNLPSVSLLFVIVLNLYIVKIFSFRPGLCCLKMTGLPSFNLTRTATINNNGLSRIKAVNDSRRSMGLLKKRLYVFALLKLCAFFASTILFHTAFLVAGKLSASGWQAIVFRGAVKLLSNNRQTVVKS